MKKFALALVLLSSSAFAEVPEFMASKVTCDQLKQELKTYGSITVVKKVLVFKKRFLIHQSEACSYDQTKNYGVFKTLDVKRCQVGEWCKDDPVYYGGSSSSDSGYSSSGSGWSSGSSWGSGSSGSGSSGSSGSSSGSHYDPPSSGSRGDNYNPPSSGTRGSRYCPGC